MRSHVSSRISSASSSILARRISASSPVEALQDALPRGVTSAYPAPSPLPSHRASKGLPGSPPCPPPEALRPRVLGSSAPGSLLHRSCLLPFSLRGSSSTLARRQLSSTPEHTAPGDEAQSAVTEASTEATEAETEAVAEGGPVAELAEASAGAPEEGAAAEGDVAAEDDVATAEEGIPSEGAVEAPREPPSLKSITSAMARRTREGKPRESVRLFYSSVRRGLVPDVPIYSTLLHAYSQMDKRIDAERVYAEMLAAGLQPSERCMGVMLTMYSRSKDMAKAWELYDQIRAAGLDPAPQLYTTLINNCFVQGDIELAHKFFAQAQSEGKAGSAQWGVMIQHVVKSGDVKGGLELLRQMVAAEVEPNTWVFTCLLQGLLHLHAFTAADAMVTYCAEHGPPPDLSTITVMLDMFGTVAGEDERAWLALLLKATKGKAYEYVVGVGNLVADSSVTDRIALEDVVQGEEVQSAQQARRKRAFSRTVTELLHAKGLDTTALKVWEEAQELGLFHGRMCIDPTAWKGGRICQIDLRELKPDLVPFVTRWALVKLFNQFTETGKMPEKTDFIVGWRGKSGGEEPMRSEENLSIVTSILEENGLERHPRKGCMVVNGSDIQAWGEARPGVSMSSVFSDNESGKESTIDVDIAASQLRSQMPAYAPSSLPELITLVSEALD